MPSPNPLLLYFDMLLAALAPFYMYIPLVYAICTLYIPLVRRVTFMHCPMLESEDRLHTAQCYIYVITHSCATPPLMTYYSTTHLNAVGSA